MKRLSNFLLGSLILCSSASAISLKDYTPYEYEVLFTNPNCEEYSYDREVINNNGQPVSSKTKNAYCKSSDSYKNKKRKNSPHARLVEWINDSETIEIFMAYLSFSNSDIQKELCHAIKTRSLKLTLVVDRKNEESESRMYAVNALKKCHSKNNIPRIITSGHTNGAGFAHNKIFIVNPDDQNKIKISFSSGNMSSGTATHHENWHFITTSPDSYFAKANLCLMNGILKHDSGKKAYTKYIESCRKKIKVLEEDDIKTFFVPGEGTKAFKTIKNAIKESTQIDMAAHRFSYSSLVNALKSQLLTKKTTMRLVLDDDLYWTGVYKKGMGRNTMFELGKVRDLESVGLQTKYIETYMNNLWNPTSMQLQHNKFLIFTFSNNSGAVFTGAGNLTGSAFSKNFENFYYITIPEVFEAYKKQYTHFWTNLSLSSSQMPSELILP